MNMLETTLPPLSSTVDFLTVTTKDPKASASLLIALLAVVGIEFVTHERKRPWNFMGYHGQAYDGLRYGVRDESAIVMLSGPLASRLWHLIAPLRGRCTRVDLAVTMTLEEANTAIVEEAYNLAVERDSVLAGKIVNSRGGTTLYLGSRTSQYFGRLYDKGAEQGGEPGFCWRYELECKKPASEVTVARLLESKEPGPFILAVVHNWFTGKGIFPMFPSENVECAIEIEARVTSDERSLEWLSSQVRPTVARLIINGRQAELLEALGLPPYVDKMRAFREDVAQWQQETSSDSA